jgi:Fe-S-cluster containining protein
VRLTTADGRSVAAAFTDTDREAMYAWVRFGYEQTDQRLDKLGLAQWASVINGRNRAIDEFAAKCVKDAPRAHKGAHVGCRVGCAACCYQTIMILSTDALLIARHMIDPGHRARIGATAAAVQRLTDDARYVQHIPCPLLVKDRCSVYDVRPHVCRSHYSLSRKACYDDLDTRVPLLSGPAFFAADVSIGADYALMKRGLQVTLGELADFVDQALAPGVIDRWLAGEAVIQRGRADYAETVQIIAQKAGLP